MEMPEYEFVDIPTDDATKNTPIKIKSGQYKDIIFRFGTISLKEDGDNLNVTMDIEVLSSPEGFNKDEELFTNTVGNIFAGIVEEGVEAKKEEKVDLEDDVHQD